MQAELPGSHPILLGFVVVGSLATQGGSMSLTRIRITPRETDFRALEVCCERGDASWQSPDGGSLDSASRFSMLGMRTDDRGGQVEHGKSRCRKTESVATWQNVKEDRVSMEERRYRDEWDMAKTAHLPGLDTEDIPELECRLIVSATCRCWRVRVKIIDQRRKVDGHCQSLSIRPSLSHPSTGPPSKHRKARVEGTLPLRLSEHEEPAATTIDSDVDVDAAFTPYVACVSRVVTPAWMRCDPFVHIDSDCRTRRAEASDGMDTLPAYDSDLGTGAGVPGRMAKAQLEALAHLLGVRFERRRKDPARGKRRRAPEHASEQQKAKMGKEGTTSAYERVEGNMASENENEAMGPVPFTFPTPPH
ncbi:hypothetical protein C8F01DRAFT_1320019 [Mycena amicta]|nr:hypothetical protein C8F01DRAFT_1320019 [Mycena amicta]